MGQIGQSQLGNVLRYVTLTAADTAVATRATMVIGTSRLTTPSLP
jgi:hypothetical protein